MINMPTTDMLTLLASSAEKPENTGRAAKDDVSFQSIVTTDDAVSDAQTDVLGMVQDVGALLNKAAPVVVRAIFPAALGVPEIVTPPQAEAASPRDVVPSTGVDLAVTTVSGIETIDQPEISRRTDAILPIRQHAAPTTGVPNTAEAEAVAKPETPIAPAPDSAKPVLPIMTPATVTPVLAMAPGGPSQVSIPNVPPQTQQADTLPQSAAIPVDGEMMNKPAAPKTNTSVAGQTYPNVPTTSLPVAGSGASAQGALALPSEMSEMAPAIGKLSVLQTTDAAPKRLGQNTATKETKLAGIPPLASAPAAPAGEVPTQPQRNDAAPLQVATSLSTATQSAAAAPQPSLEPEVEQITVKPEGQPNDMPKSRVQPLQYSVVQNVQPVDATATASETILNDAVETRPFLDVIPQEARSTDPLSPVRQDTNVNRPEVMRHVAQQLADVARQTPGRPVDLILNPEELGRVRLTFTTTDSGLHVAVMAERGETLDLLRRNIDVLAQEYRELGYRDVNFEFTGNGAGSKDDEADQDDTDQNSSSSDTTTAETITPHQLSLEPSIGLDLRL